MDEFTSFVTNYTDQLLLGAAVVAIILVPVIGYTIHKGKKVPGEEHMKKEVYVQSKRQQRKHESSLIADGIEALLLDLYTRGKLTEERYKLWHLRFGKGLRLADLLPRPIELTPVQRKQNAKSRIEVLKKSPPPKLVKEKAKPKNIVDQLLTN